MARPEIHILGASHAFLMFQELQADPLIKNKYNIICHARSGQNFQDFERTFDYKWLSELKNQDLIIIQLFGNDIFETGTHMVQLKPKKTIHLIDYKPTGLSYLAGLCEKTLTLLAGLEARVILVGHILRGFCCDQHKYPANLEYQEEIVRLIETFFAGRITVVNYLDLVEGDENTEVKPEEYLVDGTHLTKEWYRKIVNKVIQEFERE